MEDTLTGRDETIDVEDVFNSELSQFCILSYV